MSVTFSLTASDLLTLIADVVNLSLLVIAVIGIFLTRHQIRQSYDIQKATFFKEIYLTLLCEQHIRDAFYFVEKNKFVFDDRFLGSQVEKNVDALLCFFDMISRLYFGKMLTKQELHDFEYEFTVIFINKEIQRYLVYIRTIYEKREIKNIPFASFVSYCENDLHIQVATKTA